MSTRSLRAPGADHPPSPTGPPAGRAVRWPLPVGLLVVAVIGLAATVAAAEPAAAPGPGRLVQVVEAVETTAPDVASAPAAGPVAAAAAARALPGADGLATVGLTATFATVTRTDAVDDTLPTLAPIPTTTTTTTTTTTAPPPPTVAPAPAPAPAPAVSGSSDWDRLAQCEAGGNWAIDTGNGYYGGLQFSASSWAAVGGTGLPHQASRETQIAMGERLRSAQGWGAWPACSRKLGLR